MLLLNVSAYLVLLLVAVVISYYAERKLAAFIQDRLGPTHVGKWGLLQPFADLLKLLQKEAIEPEGADKILFRIAPLILFTAVFTAWSVVPLFGVDGFRFEVGVIFALGIVGLDILGLLMAGWASHSKYSLLGAMRSIAQMVSYEVPLTLSVLCALSWLGSADLAAIHNAQSAGIMGQNGFLGWSIFQNPLLLPAFGIFFIASLAECNRTPFDLPEGESELVGGFHTEYSGFRWALFFLAEYALMLLVSALAVFLFLGGGHSPFPDLGSLKLNEYTQGGIWFFIWVASKTLILVLIHIWIRWTYPRLRMDQLIFLGWKVLTPLALVNLFLVVLTRLW